MTMIRDYQWLSQRLEDVERRLAAMEGPKDNVPALPDLAPGHWLPAVGSTVRIRGTRFTGEVIETEVSNFPIPRRVCCRIDLGDRTAPYDSDKLEPADGDADGGADHILKSEDVAPGPWMPKVGDWAAVKGTGKRGRIAYLHVLAGRFVGANVAVDEDFPDRPYWTADSLEACEPPVDPDAPWRFRWPYADKSGQWHYGCFWPRHDVWQSGSYGLHNGRPDFPGLRPGLEWIDAPPAAAGEVG